MARAWTLLQAAAMETGQTMPNDPEQIRVFTGLLAIGAAAAAEHYVEHPEHLALAKRSCHVCNEPVDTLQVGADLAEQGDSGLVTVAWPCGHLQP